MSDHLQEAPQFSGQSIIDQVAGPLAGAGDRHAQTTEVLPCKPMTQSR